MSSRKKPARNAPCDMRPAMRPEMRPDLRPEMRVFLKTQYDPLEMPPDMRPPRTVKTAYEIGLEMTSTSLEVTNAAARKSAETVGELLLGLTRSAIAGQKSKSDSAIFRIEFFIDMLLPPGRASDALLDLEDVYDRRWLPKYGLRAARLIFSSQAAGLIWGFHSQRITKWVGGTLGLMKLYSWLSGPRGG
jgi:hypothetical protein